MREILLPRCLDVSVVRTVAAELEDSLRLGELTLDASAIEKVEAASLQLLCAAMTAARAQGTEVRWKSVPAVLIEGARTLALAASLGLPGTRRQEPR